MGSTGHTGSTGPIGATGPGAGVSGDEVWIHVGGSSGAPSISHIGPSTYSSGIDANPAPGLELDSSGNLVLHYNTFMMDAKGHCIGAQDPPGTETCFGNSLEVITSIWCDNDGIHYTTKTIQGAFIVVD
jgi:hypothetical protein